MWQRHSNNLALPDTFLSGLEYVPKPVRIDDQRRNFWFIAPDPSMVSMGVARHLGGDYLIKERQTLQVKNIPAGAL